MADKKISQLTAASTPLAGTEVLPIVQSSATVKVAVNDLTVKNVRSNATTGILQIAGPGTGTTRIATVPDSNFTVARTDAANSFTGNQTLSTGNLIVGTAGKGIDFSANTNAAGMTSELLTWYEEGTFTPTYYGGTTAGTTTYTAQDGLYVRIGRALYFNLNLGWSAASGTGPARIGGLPFTASNNYYTGSIISYSMTVSANNVLAFRVGYASFVELLEQQVGGTNSGQVSTVNASGNVTITGVYFV